MRHQLITSPTFYIKRNKSKRNASKECFIKTRLLLDLRSEKEFFPEIILIESLFVKNWVLAFSHEIQRLKMFPYKKWFCCFCYNFLIVVVLRKSIHCIKFLFIFTVNQFYQFTKTQISCCAIWDLVDMTSKKI